MRTPSTPAGRRDDRDATQLLMADHREVEQLFALYAKLSGAGEEDQKMLVAAQICAALEIHMQIEEEILYPAARRVFAEKDQGVVDEAVVEHAGARALIGQIEETTGDAPMFDAKVKVLSEYIAHHVDEEEREFFPKVRRAALDLAELGRQIAARRQELIMAVRRGAEADA
jgi:iron-sulfur cluster repair protein YtfE (RIC family)